MLNRTPSGRRVAGRALLGVALFTLAVVAVVVTAVQASPGPPEPTRAPCLHSADDLSLAFEQVADSVSPSVVSIHAVKRGLVRQTIDLGPGLPLERFFGRGFGQGLGDGLGEEFFRGFHFQGRPEAHEGIVQQGLGSGVILGEDGFVLTNNHVIRGADEVQVTLADDSTYPAEVVGTDPKTDLAVLRIEADDLRPARLGVSVDLRVGQWVAAMGSPYGLSSTMTAGIVSAVGRSRMGVAEYEDFIQTDAAVNPGNSGGPLVNLAGEVVGINTAIFSRTGGSMGISFAIPIDMARKVAERLIQDGQVERGWLGVLIQDLDADLAGSFGYDGTHGALVGQVTPGSPAEAAGLMEGDIVLRYAGEDVEDVDDLRLKVAETPPATGVGLEVFRAGETVALDVEIGRLEDDAVATASGGPREAAGLGMSFGPLTSDLRRSLDLPSDVTGVVVTEVTPLGPAARAGLRPNDVIVGVDGEPVTNMARMGKALRNLDLEQGVRLTVRSPEGQRFVFLRLGR